jgi:hypothetical protein
MYVHAPCQNLKFQVKNDRAEPLNLFLISNSCRKSNFIYFFKKKILFLGQENVTSFEDFGSSNSNNFLPTQKIGKNIKFNFSIRV